VGGEERAGERDQLPFTAGQRLAALVHDRVQAVGHPLNHVAEGHRAHGFEDLLVGGVRTGKGDFVAQAPSKQKRLPGHDAELAAQRVYGHPADVVAVDQDATLGGVVEARDQHGRLEFLVRWNSFQMPLPVNSCAASRRNGAV
jgi:hypothetical protein